jgi:hypothetical protein
LHGSHHSITAEYKKAYPEAKVIGVKDLTEKVKTKGLELDGGKSEFCVHRPRFNSLTTRKAYGADPVGTNYGFEDEVFLLIFIVSICP